MTEIKTDNVTSKEELDLVAKAKSGDPLAIETIIKKYTWLPRSIARKYFLTNGTLDDLVQEGMMGIFKAIRNYDPDKNNNLFSFIAMCVDSQMKDAIRISARPKHKILSDAVNIEDVDNGQSLPAEYVYDPIHNYIEKEGVENFYTSLEKLVKPQQMQVLKYYFEGYTYVEISDLTGLPTKKIDNIIYQIKTKIKKNKDMFL